MLGKTTLLISGAAGYVLGSRAGRERYDQIVEQVNKLWGNPKVQDTVSEAQDVVKKQAAMVKQRTTSSTEATTAPATPATPASPVASAPATASTAAKPTVPTGTATKPSKPGAPTHG